MSARLLAAALLLGAGPARAALAVFDAGPVPPDGTLYSADGYHYAYPTTDGREDAWIVDGAPRVRAASGALPAAGSLSADGGRLLHLVSAAGGVAAAIDGRRVGPVYADIEDLSLSPRGRNAAYAAKTRDGWVVVSAQGKGPVFPKEPENLTVSDFGTAYLAEWQGRTWLYRNHKPVRALPFDAEHAALSADLRRVGGVYRGTDGIYVEVDGKTFGPYANASAPAFSPNGRHWAFLAAKGPASRGWDELIEDGVPVRMFETSGGDVLVDDAGRAFQDVPLVVLNEKAQIHRFYLDGRLLGRPSKIGFAPGGAHFVFSHLSGRGSVVALDGREIETGAPLAVPVAAPAFDGPGEYHYWSIDGPRLQLVCGTTDGSDPKTSRCASVGASLGRGR